MSLNIFADFAEELLTVHKTTMVYECGCTKIDTTKHVMCRKEILEVHQQATASHDLLLWLFVSRFLELFVFLRV